MLPDQKADGDGDYIDINKKIHLYIMLEDIYTIHSLAST